MRFAGERAFMRYRPRFCVQRMWLCALRCCKPKQGQRGTVQRCREPAMADLRRARWRNADEWCSGLEVGPGATIVSARGR